MCAKELGSIKPEVAYPQLLASYNILSIGEVDERLRG